MREFLRHTFFNPLLTTLNNIYINGKRQEYTDYCSVPFYFVNISAGGFLLQTSYEIHFKNKEPVLIDVLIDDDYYKATLLRKISSNNSYLYAFYFHQLTSAQEAKLVRYVNSLQLEKNKLF